MKRLTLPNRELHTKDWILLRRAWRKSIQLPPVFLVSR